ncbi:endonuclease domain-containing 1 protein-like [Clarias gariepinus]|uniref:endonuclease domain-containing 1 protein-like n=1 Tax=Clarias gariepinus TaxID=13013 RepID=UPI00234D6332|nr:endonuclease domain-containing 1 protein-like [Clarias gariepinus]
MKLITLALLFSSFSSLTLTEVANNFVQWKFNCHDFFIRNPSKKSVLIVPTIFKGPQYKMICQRWKHEYRFATLYDTERRIPVFSAYTFFEDLKTKRSKIWKIEPQLENIEEYKKKKEMVDSREVENNANITHQAVDLDYKDREVNKTVYTRGHVFPCNYAASQDQADSTFTLTNVAPQSNVSNWNWEKQVEQPMLHNITNICRINQNQKVYIVTGVIPGDERLNIKRNDKNIEKGINIPSHFWSAFCCTSKNNNTKLISRAYIAELGIFKRRCTTIDKLNEQLTIEYRKRKSLKEDEYFSVFPGLSVDNIEYPC